MPTPATLSQSDSALESAESLYYEVAPGSGETHIQIVGKSRTSIPLPIDVGLNAFASGIATLGLGAGTAAATSAAVLIDPVAFTAVAATNVARLKIGNAMAITIPTGTTTLVANLRVEEPNLTATGTITTAVTVYIADAPTEGGSNFALFVDAGTTRLDGDLIVGGTAVTGARNVLGYATGGTVVTSVAVGVHVPAVSYTDAGVTGTIAVLATSLIGAMTVLATNTITYTDVAGLQVSAPVASTGATFTRNYAVRATGAIFTSTNVQVLNTASFGTTNPVGAVVFNSSGATAPVGTLATGFAIYTDGTVGKKIIANGTASNIET